MSPARKVPLPLPLPAPLPAWSPVRVRGYSPLLQAEARRLAAGVAVTPRVRDSLVLRSVLAGRGGEEPSNPHFPRNHRDADAA